MEEAYRNAFSEIYYIVLMQFSKESVSKISKKFMNFIKENRNKDYNPELPENAITKPETLKRETRIILSIMYRNYFCTSEERAILEEEDEAELADMYSYDKIFSNNKQIENDIDADKTRNIEKLAYDNKMENDSNKTLIDNKNSSEEVYDVDRKENTELMDIENMSWFKKIGVFFKQKIFSIFKRK